MNWVDVIVIVLAIIYAVAGFRNGFFVGLLSFVGFFAGAALGAQIAQPIGRNFASGNAQVAVAIVLVVFFTLLGQVLGAMAGAWLREHVTWEPARLAGSIMGAGFGVLAVLTVTWMLAVPLASSPYPELSSAVRHSKLIRSVDDVMPGEVRNVYASLRTFVNRSGFPAVIGSLAPTHVLDVAPPDNALINSAAVQGVHASVLKIYGEAPQCDRSIQGTGFVYAPHRILTNAHVVAGTSSVSVVTPDGDLRAHVVEFDPDRDIAVLYVPDLKADTIPMLKGPARTGANSIVLGYPGDGPFDAQAARIRDRETVAGRNIYDDKTVDREIYSIRGLVRSGNSGGPLIDTKGEVLGVVFATALDVTDTGFVLTNAEAAPDANRGRTATADVSTGDCA